MFKVLMITMIAIFSTNTFAANENNLKMNYRITVQIDNKTPVSGDDLYIDGSDKDLVIRSYQSGLEARIDNNVAKRSEYKSTQAIYDLLLNALSYEGYSTLIQCRTIEGSTELAFCNLHMMRSLAVR